MADIQQQIADGARPLARVGDVIAHGEAIPANVVAMRDADGDTEMAWWRVSDEPLAFYFNDERPRSGTFGTSVGELAAKWWPMTVVEVEVDPEPQPAETPLWLLPRCHCYESGDHVAHAWLDGDEPVCCWGEPAVQPQPDDEPVGARDETGCLRLKGTAIGDNQLDVPQLDEETGGTASDAEMLEVLKERDDNAEWADRLSQAVGELLGIDVGEHSNANLPWQAALIALEDAKPSGPVVLSLPQVPDGAVALVGRGMRWPRGEGSGWTNASGASFTLGAALDLYPEGVTVEFAPPREPRTWEQLDGAPDDIADVIEVRGSRYRVAVRRPHGRTTFVHEDEHGATGHVTFTLGHLRELGEVHEVLT